MEHLMSRIRIVWDQDQADFSGPEAANNAGAFLYTLRQLTEEGTGIPAGIITKGCRDWGRKFLVQVPNAQYGWKCLSTKDAANVMILAWIHNRLNGITQAELPSVIEVASLANFGDQTGH